MKALCRYCKQPIQLKLHSYLVGDPSDYINGYTHVECYNMNKDNPVKYDQVNNPQHYTTHPSGVECIQVTRHMNFNRGNAMKYIWRAGEKDKDKEIQDLEKAVWYLQDEIKLLKGRTSNRYDNTKP